MCVALYCKYHFIFLFEQNNYSFEICVLKEKTINKYKFSVYSLQKQVKEIIHKAFWDAFDEKLNEDPPDFGHAVVLIKEVKEVSPF